MRSPSNLSTRAASTLLLAAVAAFAAARPAAASELITNGGFETGDFTGFTVSTQSGSAGSFSVDNDTMPPLSSGLNTAGTVGPASGSFYALTDQTEPGAYALTQSFTVLGPSTATFSFDLFANNYNDEGLPIVNPAGLDYTADPNQHARVDLLRAGADPFSTAPADVLANFYLGSDPNATNPNPYTSYSFDITPFVGSGGTYQVRFGEVDNEGFFNLGVDNISVNATAGNPAPVPEPGTMALMGVGLASLVAARRRKKNGDKTELEL